MPPNSRLRAGRRWGQGAGAGGASRPRLFGPRLPAAWRRWRRGALEGPLRKSLHPSLYLELPRPSPISSQPTVAGGGPPPDYLARPFPLHAAAGRRNLLAGCPRRHSAPPLNLGFPCPAPFRRGRPWRAAHPAPDYLARASPPLGAVGGASSWRATQEVPPPLSLSGIAAPGLISSRPDHGGRRPAPRLFGPPLPLHAAARRRDLLAGCPGRHSAPRSIWNSPARPHFVAGRAWRAAARPPQSVSRILNTRLCGRAVKLVMSKVLPHVPGYTVRALAPISMWATGAGGRRERGQAAGGVKKRDCVCGYNGRGGHA
ncbi:hypothetical protein B0H14DRAFT_3436824 [Mycena olivaceomarginata]|nr:hypothetical protein B0H14DRAFT_3436824 [Mycena olivaceomarginata]